MCYHLMCRRIVNAEKFYTAAWAGVIELLVLSSSSMTLTIILNYQTGGLPHLLRYSKLTPTYYIASLYSSNLILIMQIVYSLILIIAVYTTFSNHFGINLYPKNVLSIVITLVISSLFFTSLSIFLNLIILRSTRKMQQLVDFIPLILGYVSASHLFKYGFFSILQSFCSY
jgi:ABC-type Na+ efflux pump permease subunit